MKFIRGILFALLFSTVAFAQTTSPSLTYSWTPGAPSPALPNCSTMTIDTVTNPVICSASTQVCISDQVLIETNSTFSSLVGVISQTLAPSTATYTLSPAPAQVATAVTHYYALSDSGRDANNNQCLTPPTTASVVIPALGVTPVLIPGPTGFGIKYVPATK